METLSGDQKYLCDTCGSKQVKFIKFKSIKIHFFEGSPKTHANKETSSTFGTPFETVQICGIIESAHKTVLSCSISAGTSAAKCGWFFIFIFIKIVKK
jgi:hypothetical protein